MPQKQNTTGLVWFRNNLRVRDNTALYQAVKKHSKVIAMYCFNPKHFEIGAFGFKKTEKYRALFLIESVQNLKENLAKQNITLLTYFQSPENILYKVCDKYLIDTIYTQKEWTTEEQQTTKLIKKTLGKLSFVENYDPVFIPSHNCMSRFFKHS